MAGFVAQKRADFDSRYIEDLICLRKKSIFLLFVHLDLILLLQNVTKQYN